MDRLARFGDRVARLARAVVPDPFVIAIVLAAVTLVAGWIAAATGGRFAGKPVVWEVPLIFARGMLSTEPVALPFGFQMALILVTGHALAAAPLVRRGLARLSDAPASNAQAAAIVAATAMVLSLFNWGLGLVAGAFLAREVGRSFARRGLKLNYALVGAAGYMGLLVWHGGLSGSAPLKVAVASSFGEAIPVTGTILRPLNLAATAALLVLIPALFFALGKGEVPAGAAPLGDGEDGSATGTGPSSVADSPRGPVDWLEGTFLVTALLVLPVVLGLGYWLWGKGAGAINLTSVILVFWIAGMILHRSPRAYARAFGDGARGAAGILLQFPIYFGILAVAEQTGLLAAIAGAFADAAAGVQGVMSAQTAGTLSTYGSAALVNLFVPSGGGQWVLQSPVILGMSQALSLDRARLVLAFAYGDELTNMLQPFWALPLLSITGLAARDILGYTLLAMLLAAPVFALALVLF